MLEKRKQKGQYLLVYGSATGQAKAIAEDIAEKSDRYGLKADLRCLDESDKKFQVEQETCMVIVVSTTGDGDPPENAAKFVRKIKRKTLPLDFLRNLNYTILGLGDTNYSNFCRCAKDIDSRFEQLGAKRFYPTGHADDGVGLEIVVDPWLEGLFPALQKFLNVDQNSEVSICEKTKPLDRSLSEESQNQIHMDGTDLVDKIITDRLPSMSEHNKVDGSSPESIISNTDQIDSTTVCLEILNINSDKIEHVHDTGKETQCGLVLPPPVGIKLVVCDCSLEGKELTVPLLPPPFLNATFINDANKTDLLEHQNGCKLPNAASDVLHVGITSAQVLTSHDAVKKTLLLQLNTKDLNLNFTPGSSMGIVCANNSSEVELLFKRLKLTDVADKKVELSVIENTAKRRAVIPPHIPPTSTLRHIFTTCLDIRQPPSKAFLRSLVNSTSNPIEMRRLQELCSKEGASLYSEHIRECNISLLDLLFAFPSCHPPVERLIEHLPRLLPRPYSVCSCPEYKPDVIDIVFNVIEIPGDPEKGHYYSRKGICTGWLDDITKCLQSGDETEQIMIPIYLRTNQYFIPPADLTKPIIMIGPGTGVAPFVGFLQQRSIRKDCLSEGQKYGETWLFFGCRNRDKDFLFREELLHFESNGTLTKLCITFSRDTTPSEKSPRYVQDNMVIMGSEICKLLVEQDAIVFICGDASNMAKDVNNCFVEILQQDRGMSKDDATMFIMKKRINKTYLEDVWV
ncbi:methionine synthase reductase-like isoform X1 [Biomphalaria glabrata]|uniref:Methionine synthase reductase n=2 Tax=Biomphalaria glabrata TaxID=6526 RepID=A0A9W2YD40_BIOGL|nr:methionine synthase reductase-like isoform X1 [Biomphalaria glabrata]XP_055860653.1 methionine synthase reductase-like isoform X1 [Biomphalaria glabrata]KAI8743437.1 methionine synthase reductase-like isoform X1 [Biomphalaria glabrata]